jgi:hypothetical protein
MHWNRTHVNPMLALRTVECNDRWKQGLADVRAWRQRVRSRHRRARAEARLEGMCGLFFFWQTRLRVLATPTRPHQLTHAQVGAGPLSRRPAATHPWRRPVVTRRCPAAKT